MIDPSREGRSITFTTRRRVTRPTLAAGPRSASWPRFAGAPEVERHVGELAPQRRSRAANRRAGVGAAIASAGRAGCRVPVTGPAIERGFDRASERRVWNMARLRRRVRLSTRQPQRHAHDPRRTAPRPSRRCHRPAPSRRNTAAGAVWLARRTWCAPSAAAGVVPMSAGALGASAVAPPSRRTSTRDLNDHHKAVEKGPKIAKGGAANQINPEGCRRDHVPTRSRRVIISIQRRAAARDVPTWFVRPGASRTTPVAVCWTGTSSRSPIWGAAASAGRARRPCAGRWLRLLTSDADQRPRPPRGARPCRRVALGALDVARNASTRSQRSSQGR